jgi:hypothetical protein
MNEVEPIQSKLSPSVKVRLYRNASDFETKYLREIEVARLPCGGLNMYDLLLLPGLDAAFEVRIWYHLCIQTILLSAYAR